MVRRQHKRRQSTLPEIEFALHPQVVGASARAAVGAKDRAAPRSDCQASPDDEPSLQAVEDTDVLPNSAATALWTLTRTRIATYMV